MRKNLISILLAGTMLTAASCDKKINSLPINDIKIKQDTQKVSLKKKESITSEEVKYMKIIFDEVGKKDEEYLNENISNTNLTGDEEALKKDLIGKLKEKEHTLRTNNPLSSEDYSQINELSINQNKVIYLMLNSLQDSSFCNEIGKIIEGDIKNKYSESGGIVTFKGKNKIKLKPIESELSKLKDEENDGQYLLPSDEHFSKKIAYFHLHSSKYNEKEFAGPSTTDLFILEAQAAFSSLVSEFIITPLEKGRFNVDYAGVDRKKDKNARAVDLGNYLYDTLIIK